jgi:hypothetical protein
MDVYVTETQRSKKKKENERECVRSNNELWKWRD